uniref:Uncharacterized protein n=1 Tax=Ditylenchus dipsaci TaxID=166011 RepID=A0A915EQ27_9BILA
MQVAGCYKTACGKNVARSLKVSTPPQSRMGFSIATSGNGKHQLTEEVGMKQKIGAIMSEENPRLSAKTTRSEIAVDNNVLSTTAFNNAFADELLDASLNCFRFKSPVSADIKIMDLQFNKFPTLQFCPEDPSARCFNDPVHGHVEGFNCNQQIKLYDSSPGILSQDETTDLLTRAQNKPVEYENYSDMDNIRLQVVYNFLNEEEYRTPVVTKPALDQVVSRTVARLQPKIQELEVVDEIEEEAVFETTDVEQEEQITSISASDSTSNIALQKSGLPSLSTYWHDQNKRYHEIQKIIAESSLTNFAGIIAEIKNKWTYPPGLMAFLIGVQNKQWSNWLQSETVNSKPKQEAVNMAIAITRLSLNDQINLINGPYEDYTNAWWNHFNEEGLNFLSTM